MHQRYMVVRKHYNSTFIRKQEKTLKEYSYHKNLLDGSDLYQRQRLWHDLSSEFIKNQRVSKHAYCQYVRHITYDMIKERQHVHFIGQISHYELAIGSYYAYIKDEGSRDITVNKILDRNEKTYLEMCDRYNGFCRDNNYQKTLDWKIVAVLSLFRDEYTEYNWISDNNTGLNYEQILNTNLTCDLVTQVSCRVARAYPREYELMINNLEQEEVVLLLSICMHYGLKKMIYRQLIANATTWCSCVLYEDLNNENMSVLDSFTKMTLRCQAIEKIINKVYKHDVKLNYDPVVLREAVYISKRATSIQEAEGIWLTYARFTKNTNRVEYFMYVYNIVKKIIKMNRNDLINTQHGTITLKKPTGEYSRYHLRDGRNAQEHEWWQKMALKDEGIQLIGICVTLVKDVELLIATEMFSRDIDIVDYNVSEVMYGRPGIVQSLQLFQSILDKSLVRGYTIKSCFLENKSIRIGDGRTGLHVVTYDHLVDAAYTILYGAEIEEYTINLLCHAIDGVIGGKQHEHTNHTKKQQKKWLTQNQIETVKGIEKVLELAEKTCMDCIDLQLPNNMNEIYYLSEVPSGILYDMMMNTLKEYETFSAVFSEVVETLENCQEYTDYLSETIDETNTAQMAVKMIYHWYGVTARPRVIDLNDDNRGNDEDQEENDRIVIIPGESITTKERLKVETIKEEHEKHVREVLQRLRENRLYANKCEGHSKFSWIGELLWKIHSQVCSPECTTDSIDP